PPLLRLSGLRLRSPRSLRLRPLAYAPGSAGVRSCSPDPLPDGNSGKTEAEVVAPVRRRDAQTVRRHAGHAEGEPVAAPHHPEPFLALALGGGGPLQHVAVHVGQSQLIRRIRANPRGSSEVLSLRRVAER